MPDKVLPNNPYDRPINASRPEGQMLVGEFYGKRANDKQLVGLHGHQVSSASRYSGRAVTTPVDMDAPPSPEKKARKPRPVKVEEPVSTVETAITEDDLFG